jgi:hypothetical protein
MILLCLLLLALVACKDPVLGSKAVFSYPEGYAYTENTSGNTTIATLEKGSIRFVVTPLEANSSQATLENIIAVAVGGYPGTHKNSTWEKNGNQYREETVEGTRFRTATTIQSPTGTAFIFGESSMDERGELIATKAILLDTMRVEQRTS